MSRFFTSTILFVIILIAIFSYGYQITHVVPKDFPVGTNFTIEENESLRKVSQHLEKEHYIQSALWFRVWVSLLGRDRHMQLGTYRFDTPYTLGGVIKKILLENPDKPLIQVTIPEGSTVAEVATLLYRALPTLSVDVFLEKVSTYKATGKLFPSTYFLIPSNTEEGIVKLMTETFEKKYTSMFRLTAIPEPLTSVVEVISLAAILEGEAKTEEDMRIVAGVLLARLKQGMPLQVDVAMETYKVKGLPLIPINNPGLMALSAVLHPVESEYLFYITGKDGAMHYAKTFAEHKKNIQKYLK